MQFVIGVDDWKKFWHKYFLEAYSPTHPVTGEVIAREEMNG